MIIIALGSNLNGQWGSPREAVGRALSALNELPTHLIKASNLIETEPFGIEDQARFINAVALIDTKLSPEQLMQHLHNVEKSAGRSRALRWGPRTLDLDLIDYNGLIINQSSDQLHHLVLPHPGIEERGFVLEPIAEIAPTWRHPVSNRTARQMLDALSPA